MNFSIDVSSLIAPHIPQFTVMNPISNAVISPTISNNIQLPDVSSIITTNNFSLDYCRMIPTPTAQIFDNPPFMYDIANPANQPLGLISLKSLHNDIHSQVYDGTSEIAHPIEPLIQHQVLKNLKSDIEKYCE